MCTKKQQRANCFDTIDLDYVGNEMKIAIIGEITQRYCKEHNVTMKPKLYE
jgi:hypothetical protein